MKVYFIYKNDKINNPHLYAITDKKDLKNSFMEERKKSLFVVKKKELEKDEYKEFIRNHSTYLLGRRWFETKPSSSNSLEKRAVAYITATQSEEMDVFMKMDDVLLEISKFTDEASIAFNTKLLHALNKLMYFEIKKYREIIYNTYNYFTDGVEYAPISDIKIDALGVFLYLYGNTMSSK